MGPAFRGGGIIRLLSGYEQGAVAELEERNLHLLAHPRIRVVAQLAQFGDRVGKFDIAQRIGRVGADLVVRIL